MHEEPLIEKNVEDPPHVTSTENSDDWECFHDYCSVDDHICTPNIPKDEIIAEYYSETYDENRNVHDGTPTCSPYNDDSLEYLLPCSHFSEEDEYENEDKYNLDHDTSDEDSLMSDKDVEEMLKRSPGHSWKIQSMKKIMNQKLWMVLLILLSMAYLKERTWTLWPWEIFR